MRTCQKETELKAKRFLYTGWIVKRSWVKTGSENFMFCKVYAVICDLRGRKHKCSSDCQIKCFRLTAIPWTLKVLRSVFWYISIFLTHPFVLSLMLWQQGLITATELKSYWNDQTHADAVSFSVEQVFITPVFLPSHAHLLLFSRFRVRVFSQKKKGILS